MTSPLRLLIVDDEAPARTRLRDLLADIRDQVPNEVVAEAANGREALAALERHAVDIALVDIRMPGMDGIELARHVARLPAAPSIIFLTAFDQYAVQAFELSAIDYLLKPVRAQRLADALVKAVRRRPDAAALGRVATAAREHLSCAERGRILLVPVADILYLKAEQKYVTARTRDREYLLEESLVQLEEELGERFLRIHRNCLVARQAVTGVERVSGAEEVEPYWEVLIAGIGERLPVSRRQWPALKAALKA